MVATKKNTIRLTVAQAVVRFLSVQFSERDGATQRLIPGMFGIFGHGNVAGLGQALEEHGNELTYYQPCNEQSMVHTAASFAKATFRKQTLACTSSIGPGATNMLTGAALATINRLPVLLLPADYYVTRHQGPVLQQLEHPLAADVSVNDAFRPLSRFFDRISRPEQLLTALPEAMRVLTDPAETGAVTISLPQDLQAHAYDFPDYFFEKRVWPIERRYPHPERIDQAVALIKNAKRPAIIAGGGVHYSEAWNELEQFAEAFGIPVGETFGGKGSIRNGSAMLLGGHGVTGTPAAAKFMREADLVICVGTRLTDFSTSSQSCFNNSEVQFIGINVSGHDSFKQGALPITADARETLTSLESALKAAGHGPQEGYVTEISTTKNTWEEHVEKEVYSTPENERLGQGHLIGIMNSEAQSGDTIIAASGGPPGDLLKLWDVSQDRKCQLEFGYSCMGYEIPAGLGARMSQPEGEIYVFIGDGTYLMNPTEIVTAVQENLKITVIVSENHGYQCIRQLQMARAGHSFGNEFRRRDGSANRLEGEFLAIDYAKNAESFGARAWHCKTEADVRAAFRAAREETRSCVIVIETEKYRYTPWSETWWDVAPAEVTDDSVTREIRQQYDQDRENLQRLHY